MYIITPLHRPEDITNAYENALRQSGWKWIVIEDVGNSICIDAGIKPDVLLHSEPHVSHARNKGLEYIRSKHKDPQIWVNMDADDYYGQGYADNKAQCLFNNKRIADISTAKSLYVSIDDNYYYTNNPGSMGSTLAGWSDCQPYGIHSNEDGIWYEMMMETGARNNMSDGSLHCYCKTPRGVWKIENDKLIAEYRIRAGLEGMYILDNGKWKDVPLSICFK